MDGGEGAQGIGKGEGGEQMVLHVIHRTHGLEKTLIGSNSASSMCIYIIFKHIGSPAVL